MKKTTPFMLFYTKLLNLSLSFAVIIIAISPVTVMADPLNKTVTSKGSLSRIVARNYPNSSLSRAQIMIAILAANPSVFKGGNINFMSRNKKLTLPTEAVIENISVESAAKLLAQHNRFYQKGVTGNLTPPTFINTGADPVILEKLRTENNAQTERVKALAEESEKLQSVVQHLEAEKNQRDEDLRLLEEKIQTLKEAEEEGTQFPIGTRDSKDQSLNEQRLREKNAALQQQLVESKSELIENNRTTISLERRVIELQQKEAEKNNKSPSQQNNPQAVVATDKEVIPSTDLNGNIINPDNKVATGFDLSRLTWLLPLLALLVGILVFLRRFLKHKKHSELNLDEIDDFDFATPKMTDKERGNFSQETIATPTDEEAPLEVSIKLDVARAYMEAEDNQSAYEMLTEVLKEGNAEQQAEANQLLKKL